MLDDRPTPMPDDDRAVHPAFTSPGRTARSTIRMPRRSRRKSSSTPTPGSPTGCGPLAKPPMRSRPPTAAPAPRSTARSHGLRFRAGCRARAQDYAELLEESGREGQARAPMTPIVKLVFGIDYDKARLTEFAAALCLTPAGRTSSRAVSQVHRKPGRRAQGAGRGRAPGASGPSPKPDTQGRSGEGEAARSRSDRARNVSGESSSHWSSPAVVPTVASSRSPGRRRGDGREGHPPRRP